eukprot:7167180-Lingulodinium_polyedra.AAC.1
MAGGRSNGRAPAPCGPFRRRGPRANGAWSRRGARTWRTWLTAWTATPAPACWPRASSPPTLLARSAL